MNPLLIALAIAPALIICWYIYRLDRYDQESHWQLIACFVLGMLITFPAMQLEALGESYGLEEPHNFWKLLVLSFIVVALTEELVKFLVLLGYAFPRKAFNEPMDGIVYSVMISMGFATLENLIYADRFGLGTTVMRAFTAVPAHAVFGVIIGYYTGLAKFNKKDRIPLLLKGLLIAVLVHGIYDFFILQEYHDYLMVLATLTLCISAYFAIKLIRVHQVNSPFRKNYDEVVTEISGDEPEVVSEEEDEKQDI